MVTWATPPPTPRGRQIPRLEALPGPGSALDEHRSDDAPAHGRLVRVMELARGESTAYLDRWAAQRPPARRIDVPAGIAAAERRRPEAGAGALAAHWSVPEPPMAADMRAWSRLLERLRTS